MIKNLLLLSSFGLLFLGCKQDDITPSWLRIDEFQLTTNEATQGVNTHKITDAWLYLDTKPLGVHSLPCVIPVLEDGEHELLIFPGIENMSITDNKLKYPFYNSYEETIDLSLNDTTTVAPSTTYKNSVEFSYIEDFEGAGISLVKSSRSDTDVVFVQKTEFPDIVAYGEKCGGIHLTQEDSLYAGSTIEGLVLPKASEVFLEFDYRNNNSMELGTVAIFPDGSTQERTPLAGMKPQETGSEEWKKMYVSLKEDVNFQPSAVAFEIFIISLIDNNNTAANIYIDNIKVVHY